MPVWRAVLKRRQPPLATGDGTWARGLPALRRTCAEGWGLTLGAPYPASGTTEVTRATRADGTPVVLKLSPPVPGLEREARALAHWDGVGAVRLVAADLTSGALLLERAEPGTSLVSLGVEHDRGATAAAGRVMRELGRAPGEERTLPDVSEWVEELEQTRLDAAPPRLRRAGRDALHAGRELVADCAPRFVLHGDLHHGNVLRAAREPWLAIDPKGVRGPPEAEAAAFLRNPRGLVLAHPSPARLMQARILGLTETAGLDPTRMRAWGWVLAVVAAWWSFEDRETGWEQWLACAEAIQRSG
ncbi:MAG TPA: aminoglycoside phosphotransferase family protein [Gemmatimonadaceae bacterium]|nr:aminoglycoside phosphotransferase family protein [Gemmatimonadaceae bacterium]